MARVTNCVVFDLDGTIADISHRRVYVENKPKNWAKFNATICDDIPNEPVVQLLRALHASKNPIVICSGREAVSKKVTVDWLARHDIPYSAIYMRRAKDYRQDDVVKADLLDELMNDGWYPWIVVDDRDRVVNMWRQRGFTCLQCAPGAF